MSTPLDKARRAAAYRRDSLFGEDAEPPNPHAQRRGFLIWLMIFAVAAVLVLLSGAADGVAKMAEGLQGVVAPGDSHPWITFLHGLGKLVGIGLVLVVAFLLLIRRLRCRS